jgi:hypothetical protein
MAAPDLDLAGPPGSLPEIDQEEIAMVRLFVRHNVNDYAAWRKAYDDFDEERQSMGVGDHAVFRTVGEPNDVTLWHDFASVESAEAFMASERLREVMEGAGVAGEPTIWYVERD